MGFHNDYPDEFKKSEIIVKADFVPESSVSSSSKRRCSRNRLECLHVMVMHALLKLLLQLCKYVNS